MPTTHSSPRRERLGRTERVAPGLAFPRLFSESEVHFLNAVQWERRTLLGSPSADRANDLRREVEVPAEWSSEAAAAFLHDSDASENQLLSIRSTLSSLVEEVRAAARGGGYFVRAEDAAIFAEELGALLLSQRGTLLWRTGATALNGLASDQLLTLDDPMLEQWLTEDRPTENRRPSRWLALLDAFMLAAEGNGAALEGEPVPLHTGAQVLLRRIAQSAANSGETVLVFPDTVRRWEPMIERDTRFAFAPPPAGVATINLHKLLQPDGRLDLAAYRHSAALLLTALEVLIDQRPLRAAPEIQGVRKRRCVSLGVANAGAALVAGGIAYDSACARTVLASLSALLCAQAFQQSARIAETCPPLRTEEYFASGSSPARPNSSSFVGACLAFREHPETFLEVLRQQRAQAYRMAAPQSSAELPHAPAVIPIRGAAISGPAADGDVPLARQLPELIAAARAAWDGALLHAELFGLRHTAVTGMAGDHTTARMLDCDTPGLEPVRSLLIDGGRERERERAAATLHLAGEVAPYFAAVVPLPLCVPFGLPPEELAQLLLTSWHCGVKAVAVQGCPAPPTLPAAETPGSHDAAAAQAPPPQAQVTDVLQQTASGGSTENAEASDSRPLALEAPAKLSTSAPPVDRQSRPTIADVDQATVERNQTALMETQLDRIGELQAEVRRLTALAAASEDRFDAQAPPRAVRHRLPAERASVTHAFEVAGHHGYIMVGLYPNGVPGEIFVRMTKEGSAVAGLLDSFAAAASLGLQHGVPVRVLAEQFSETRFEPSGPTANEAIPFARSIVDYLFRWIELRFLSGQQLSLFTGLSTAGASDVVRGNVSDPKAGTPLKP